MRSGAQCIIRVPLILTSRRAGGLLPSALQRLDRWCVVLGATRIYFQDKIGKACAWSDLPCMAQDFFLCLIDDKARGEYII